MRGATITHVPRRSPVVTVSSFPTEDLTFPTSTFWCTTHPMPGPTLTIRHRGLKQGACCPKETGVCNYGPDACGTTGTSPNDVCWSNCDAHAECGRYAETPGKKCPLNVVGTSFLYVVPQECRRRSTATPVEYILSLSLVLLPIRILWNDRRVLRGGGRGR